MMDRGVAGDTGGITEFTIHKGTLVAVADSCDSIEDVINEYAGCEYDEQAIERIALAVARIRRSLQLGDSILYPQPSDQHSYADIQRDGMVE